MFRWSLLPLALVLLVLGLLTVRPSPDWSPWKLAVLAGEFGHWLAVLALVLVAAAWVGPGRSRPLAVAITVAGAAGGALLLVPTLQARRLARELPATLETTWGAGPRAAPAFSLAGFLASDPAPVPVTTLSPGRELPVDFYAPVPPPATPAPCVIVVHGGGWDSGDRKQLPKLNHWLARRGFAVAAVSYRLAPQHRWPAQRIDVEAAIAFLKSRAASLAIDPARLVLLGRSAGGQIAEVVAYTANDPAIRGVVALYAPSDLYFGYVNTHEDDMLHSPALMRQFLGGPPEAVRAQYESASALNFVTPRSPPTLLLHGRNDALAWHRHSERLAARLAEQGVPHVYVALPWATHGFDFNLHGPGGQLTTYALEWFLRAVTAPPAGAPGR